MKKLSILFITSVFLFTSCEKLFQEDPLTQSETYSEKLVQDFVQEISNTGTRALTYTLTEEDKAVLLSAIYTSINNSSLAASEDMGAILEAIIAGSQAALADIGADDSEKLYFISEISKASVVVVGINSDSVTPQELNSAVESVAGSVIKNLSQAGISPENKLAAVENAVGNIVVKLSSAHVDSASFAGVLNIIAEASVASLAGNEAFTTAEILGAVKTLSNTIVNYAASAEGITLSDTLKSEILSEVLTGAGSGLQLAGSVDAGIDTSSLFTEMTSSLIDTVLADISDGTIADKTVKIVISSSSEVLMGMGSDADIDNLIVVISSKDNVTLDLASLIAAAEEGKAAAATEEISLEGFLLEARKQVNSGQWEKGLYFYSQALEEDPRNAEALIWWSLLTLGNIVVDPAVQDTAAKMGFVNYPATMNEFFNSSWAEATAVEDYDYYYGTTTTYFMPEITIPEELGTYVDTDTYMQALVINLIKNSPEGFDHLTDTLVSVTSAMERVSRQIQSLPEDATMTLAWDMFYTDDFNPVKSLWPQDLGGTPMDIVIGKAELLASTVPLDLLRSAAFMSHSLSLSVDLQSYWDSFNPYTGKAFLFDATEPDFPIGLNSSFDWGSVSSPFTGDFLRAKADAALILNDAKTHFVSAVTNLKTSAELIAQRDVTSSFYISPATPSMTAEWGTVTSIQGLISTVADKILASVNGEVIYFPDASTLPADPFELANPLNWPTSGTGVNLSVLFESPVLAIDNIFEFVAGTGEFQFYTQNSSGVMTPVTYDTYKASQGEGVYFIKIKDSSLGGLYTAEELPFPVAGSVVVEGTVVYLGGVPSYNVGNSVIPQGETFIFASETGSGFTAKSRGSFWFGIESVTGGAYSLVSDVTPAVGVPVTFSIQNNTSDVTIMEIRWLDEYGSLAVYTGNTMTRTFDYPGSYYVDAQIVTSHGTVWMFEAITIE